MSTIEDLLEAFSENEGTNKDQSGAQKEKNRRPFDAAAALQNIRNNDHWHDNMVPLVGALVVEPQ